MVVVDLSASLVGSLSLPGTDLFGLSPGGDGGVWAADVATNSIIRYTFFGGGGVNDTSTHTVPTPNGQPRQIVWCQALGFAFATEFNAIPIVRAFFSGSSVSASNVAQTPSGPAAGVACGADGIWYTVPTTNKIGRITAAGVLQEWDVPTPASTVYGLVVALDGSIWFAENGTGKIGRLRVNPPGDVNGDGQVSVADVFYTINFLFAGGPAPVP